MGKHFWRFLFITILCLSFVACANTSDDDERIETGEQLSVDDDTTEQNVTMNDEEHPTPTATPEIDEEQKAMADTLASCYFTEISIDVDYEKDIDFEAEIDNDDGIIEAKVEDDLTDKRIYGKEAFDYIFERINALELTSDTASDDVITQITEALEINNDYREISIEIKYQDGTRREFEKKRN